MTEDPAVCILKSVTVSREPNGKYYTSLLFEYPEKKRHYDIDPDNAICLDMSMSEFYIDSNGDMKDTPHAYKKLQNRIAVEQRRLSHMKKGSSNYQKQRPKIDWLTPSKEYLMELMKQEMHS